MMPAANDIQDDGPILGPSSSKCGAILSVRSTSRPAGYGLRSGCRGVANRGCAGLSLRDAVSSRPDSADPDRTADRFELREGERAGCGSSNIPDLGCGVIDPWY